MTLILGLIVAAFVLIFFEVLLPGGILGLIAALCILAATWLGFSSYGFFGGALIFVLSLLASVLLVFVEFKLMAKTSLGKGFFLKTEVSGHSNEIQGEAELVGKEAKTLTRLNPSGKVAIEGRTYEAYSEDGYVDSGISVVVARRDSFKLIIRKV